MVNNNDENLQEGGIEKAGVREKTRDAKAELINHYFSKKLAQGGKDAKFLNELIKSEEVPEEMKDEMKKTYLKLPSYSSLSESDVNSITYSDVVIEIASEVSELRSQRQTTKNTILKEYNITSSLYDSKIGKKVDKMSSDELDDLLEGGEKERRLLVRDCFGNNMPHARNASSFLEDFDLKDRRKKLSPEKQDELDLAIKLLKDQGGNLDYVTLETFFELGIFTPGEQKQLITTFIPSMSLTKATELGIVDDKQEKKLKEQYVDEGAKTLKLDKHLGRSELRILKKQMFDELSHEDLVFDTATIKNFDTSVGKFIEDGQLEKIVDGHNDVLAKVRDANTNIKTFETFQEELGRILQNPLQAAKFTRGSTIALKQQKKGEEAQTYFFEIQDSGEKTGNVILASKGVGSYNKFESSLVTNNFDEVIEVATKGDTPGKQGISTLNFEILDASDLKSEKNNGRIPLADDVIELKDFGSNDEKIVELNNDIAGIDDQIARRKAKLYDEGVSQKKIDADEDLEKLRKKREILSGKQEKLFEANEDIETGNLNGLKTAIKQVDPSGETHGFEEGTSFMIAKGGPFTIQIINSVTSGGSITFASPAAKGGAQTMSFNEFFEAFKANGAERVSNIKDINDLFSSVQGDGDVGAEWGKFKVEGSDFVRKESKQKLDYDHLVSKEGAELLKLHSIDGGMARISLGEVKDNKKKGKDGKEEKIGEIFASEDTMRVVSLGFLENYIKKHGLVPRSLKEEKVKDETFDATDNRHNSFFHRLLDKNYSIFDLMSGSKLFIENLQSFLKEGSDEHAAKFASGFYGKFLPEEVQVDLKARVEQAGKKRMDEYIDKLGSVDSPIATDMILKWLKNKDVSQHKLDAAVIFMMGNYGTLYTKKMANHQGDFIWYKAFNGKVGDAFYNEIKNECESSEGGKGENFSEEELMYKWLVRRCKRGELRSRLHKEFKSKRASGKNEDYEKGQREVKDERTIDARNKVAQGELEGGTYAYMIGAMEQAIDKGGSYEQMNKMPFILAFSGVTHEFDRAMVPDMLKKFTNDNRLVPMMRFLSYTRDIDLQSNTILGVCERIAEVDPTAENKAMYVEALSIHGNQKKKSDGSEAKEQQWRESKVKKTAAFFDKYGELLTDVMYQTNTGKTDKASRYNKLIFLEKDAGIGIDGKHQDGNDTFKQYHDLFEGYMNADTKIDNEDYADDNFSDVGITGLDMKMFVRDHMGFDQGGKYRKARTGPKIWSEIQNEFNAISNRDYTQTGLKSKENIEIQHKIIKMNLRGLLAGMIENHGGTGDRGLSNYETGSFLRLMNWGIRASVDLKGSPEHEIDPNDRSAQPTMNIAHEEITAESNAYFEGKMDKWVDNILNFEQTGVPNSTANVGLSQKEQEQDDENLFKVVKYKGDTQDTINNIVGNTNNNSGYLQRDADRQMNTVDTSLADVDLNLDSILDNEEEMA